MFDRLRAENETLNDEARMGFLEHLNELRTRLIRAAVALVVGVLICFFFAETLYAWLLMPLMDALPENKKSVYFLNPVEPFLVYLKVSFLAGLFVASPAVLYQIWKFVAPGLYPREKKAVLPFVLFGSLFFVGGALFCRYVVLPTGLEALMGVGFQTELFDVQSQITMDEYFGVATKLMLAFGVVFELPVVVLFLSWVGMINHKTLLRHWRGFVVGAFVVGAILTPPDVMTQLMLAGPIMLLYLLSIGIAYLFGNRNAAPPEGVEDEDD
ncbi:MAG: twin-arginine translocase subunit TatC [Deltaproteobacteria bacterium CG_4_9_14_3_um_filter_63_12]|nr:MAG: twin-arginine translocase subunit TatC [Deltaproteobacteria bacterium CG17_big_fil_post_rev_8_21_14_2_50_63_7]PJB37942.1 MAG: twin-arginine translocase subunit TatC [Deltaproteobacteria bacterium CG_4_9_14_3_um_filter_63_12]